MNKTTTIEIVTARHEEMCELFNIPVGDDVSKWKKIIGSQCFELRDQLENGAARIVGMFCRQYFGIGEEMQEKPCMTPEILACRNFSKLRELRNFCFGGRIEGVRKFVQRSNFLYKIFELDRESLLGQCLREREELDTLRAYHQKLVEGVRQLLPQKEGTPARKVEDMGLSVRVVNCLKAEGIETEEGILAYGECELLKTPNLGRTAVGQIKQVLPNLGR